MVVSWSYHAENMSPMAIDVSCCSVGQRGEVEVIYFLELEWFGVWSQATWDDFKVDRLPLLPIPSYVINLPLHVVDHNYKSTVHLMIRTAA